MQTDSGWNLCSSYSSLPATLFAHVAPTPVAAPQLVIFNHELAQTLGLDFGALNPAELASIFSGNQLPTGAIPLAQAYAGHQFGHFAQLGDGRAHLLGEQRTPSGDLVDLQLKGSGPTPYSRRGDGRAALAPMLREYLISEAMHALGIATTRSLAVVTTGESVWRQSQQPGAILTRVAASHLRVGTFEYAAATQDKAVLQSLADYAITRHYPDLQEQQNPYWGLLQRVAIQQANLVAAWMHVGFIHGVMNTDNMTISGQTIDYGPCAFMDQFSIQRVFSSIDRQGRYAYGNQHLIAHWNLTRLAESLLPLLHADAELHVDEDQAATLAEAALEAFSDHFNEAWLAGMRKKLGLFAEQPEDQALINALLQWMQDAQADYTRTFRDLIGGDLPTQPQYQQPSFTAWHAQWRSRLTRNPKPLASAWCLMRANNPVIIARNHQVEQALTAAEAGDLSAFLLLLTALQQPYLETESNHAYRFPPAQVDQHYRTFCGT